MRKQATGVMMKKTGNQLMTAPVLASRCPVFAPSIRQGRTDWSVKTPWGSASVEGNITQTHRNILDAIFAFAIDTKEMHTGAIEVLVDPYVIATKTHSSRDYKWLADKMSQSILRDMKDAMVCVEDERGLRHIGGIVSEWREANRRVPMPGGALSGDRPLLAITISAAWMRLYRSTLTVSYPDLIPAISKLNRGVLQALVRFCLTHRQLNMRLDEALRHIGAITETTSRTRRFASIKTVTNSAVLSYFGIAIKEGVVRYEQHDLVRFKNPDSPATCAESPATCAASPATCAVSQEIQDYQEA